MLILLPKKNFKVFGLLELRDELPDEFTIVATPVDWRDM
jgi:hypothetical protein